MDLVLNDSYHSPTSGLLSEDKGTNHDEKIFMLCLPWYMQKLPLFLTAKYTLQTRLL